MKQQSKLVLRLTLALALLPAALLSACAGLGDWSFKGLPGDYEVWRFSAHVIKVVKLADESGTVANAVVGSFVSDIWWKDDYILAKQKPEDTDPESSASYYIVEVSTDEVLGPYSKEEFDARISDLGIPFSQEDWIDVWDLPRDSS